MKTLTQYILEVSSEDIDEYWLNNNKPVMTVSKIPVIIKDIDYSEVPNIITGELLINGRKTVWKWYDTGECIEATDNIGNNRKPDETDKLVKAQ